MIYEQKYYNLNVKFFDNLIEINIKNIPNKFIRFKIYENILHFFELYKCNMLIKYYDQEFLIYSELDLKNVFKKLEIQYVFLIFKNNQIFCYKYLTHCNSLCFFDKQHRLSRHQAQISRKPATKI